MREQTKLVCPICGWKYNPSEYAAAYMASKYVPHHPNDGGGWCWGTEQTPKPDDNTEQVTG